MASMPTWTMTGCQNWPLAVGPWAARAKRPRPFARHWLTRARLKAATGNAASALLPAPAGRAWPTSLWKRPPAH